MNRKYQRRTQKGMGRTEKTPHNGAAKNPRLLQACNTTAMCDTGEFFFISMSDEFVGAKLHIFLNLRGLKCDFYVNFTSAAGGGLPLCFPLLKKG
jgi:hypothetical protein